MRTYNIVDKYNALCKKYDTDIKAVLDSRWEKATSKDATENDNIEPSVLDEMGDEDLDILYEYIQYLKGINEM